MSLQSSTLKLLRGSGASGGGLRLEGPGAWDLTARVRESSGRCLHPELQTRSRAQGV